MCNENETKVKYFFGQKCFQVCDFQLRSKNIYNYYGNNFSQKKKNSDKNCVTTVKYLFEKYANFAILSV